MSSLASPLLRAVAETRLDRARRRWPFPRQYLAAGLAMLAAAALLPAGAAAHDIKIGALVIHHPWSRQSPVAADVAAGFMTITNTGSTDDRLVKATAEISRGAQIHDMKMSGDVMKMMEQPDGVVIPAGATVTFKPMGLHVMFMGLTQQVMVGEQFSGTLTFEKAGTVAVDYEVAAPGANMSGMH